MVISICKYTIVQEHALEPKVTNDMVVEDCLCMKDGVVQTLGTVSRRLQVTKKGDKKAGKEQLENSLSKMAQERSQKSATIRPERPDKIEAASRKRKADSRSLPLSPPWRALLQRLM